MNRQPLLPGLCAGSFLLLSSAAAAQTTTVEILESAGTLEASGAALASAPAAARAEGKGMLGVFLAGGTVLPPSRRSSPEVPRRAPASRRATAS